MTKKSSMLEQLRQKKISAEFEIKQLLDELDRQVKGVRVVAVDVNVSNGDDHPEIQWISKVEIKMEFDPK